MLPEQHVNAPFNLGQIIDELKKAQDRAPEGEFTPVMLGQFPIYQVLITEDSVVLSYDDQEYCTHCGRYDCDPANDTGCDAANEEFFDESEDIQS